MVQLQETECRAPLAGCPWEPCEDERVESSGAEPAPALCPTADELAVVQTALVDRWTATVLTAFADADLPAVLLKGPAVARWLYPDDPGRRPYVDADLLVRAADERRATQVLTGLGFVEHEPSGLHHGLPMHSTDWRRARDGALVDLHTSLHGLTLIDPDQVWAAVLDGADTLEVDGVTATVPGLAMRALHVALHLLPRYGPAHRPWHDLVRAVEVVDRATWVAAARLAVDLRVDDVLGANLRRVGPAGAALADALELTPRPPSTLWLRGSRQRVRWIGELRTLPGLRRRLRFVLELVFPRPEVMAAYAGLEHPTTRRLAVLYLTRIARAPVAAIAAMIGYLRAESRRQQIAAATADTADALPILRTVGSSMIPTLQPGDVVIIDPAATQPRLGDIAVLRRGDGLVVHRVVSSTRRLQMGDNTTVALPYGRDDVVGTVVARLRGTHRHDLRTVTARGRGALVALRHRVTMRARRWRRARRLTR